MNFHVREIHSDLYQAELEKQKNCFEEPAKQSSSKIESFNHQNHEKNLIPTPEFRVVKFETDEFENNTENLNGSQNSVKIEPFDKDPAIIQYFNPTDNWGAEVYQNDVLMADSKIPDAMDNNVLMTASEISNDIKVVNEFLPIIQDVYQLEDTFDFGNENDSQTENNIEMIPYK